MNFAPEMMIKQYVAEFRNARGVRFRVFRTGSDKHYLFAPLDQYGCDRCAHFPVLKRDLRQTIKSALANGVSLDLYVDQENGRLRSHENTHGGGI